MGKRRTKSSHCSSACFKMPSFSEAGGGIEPRAATIPSSFIPFSGQERGKPSREMKTV